ncbi:hypothetical protein CPT_Sycamore_018 [Streptomyces phage Sycamore]|uniref:Minor tail protein n=1 Tax=Streptomyces phage Sycamore TaxID=2767589 RepID=A0A873WHF9_9CAUD|nr:hypothetical protein CPT_Sycamore_018 [Streptomyces phage Sycamore]
MALFNLPASVPTVTLHGKYLGPDGRPLSGWVEILAPIPLTFPNADAFVTGPVIVPLDSEGTFAVTLPATDVAGSNPTDWAYWITEKLQGVNDRKPYAIKLPQALKDPWLDDLAPTDPGTPNYVGVEGARIYQGTDVPPAGLGRHGDMYVRTDVTAAFLNVSDTRVTTYAKVDATWVLQTGEVRGSKIYVNNTSTSSSATKPGDLLIRSDNGDFYQRDAAGWGAVKGNLKGPKGDKGDTGATGAASTVPGPKGDKGDTGATGAAGADGSKVYAFASGTEASGKGVPGDFAIRTDTGNVYLYELPTGWTSKGSIKGPKGDTGAQGPQGVPGQNGTGSGTVNAVNGVQPDGTGLVTLTPANVGALPLTGGTIQPASGNGLTVYGATSGAIPTNYFRVTADGHTYSNSLRNTFYNIGVGDTSADFAGGNRALAFQNATVIPTTNPANGVVAYSEGGVLKVRQSDGTIVTVGSGGVTSVNSKTGAVTLAASDVGALATSDKGATNGVASLVSGKVPIAQIPTTVTGSKNEWSPSALGFAAWTVDPASTVAYTATASKYTRVGRIFYAGFNITEDTQVNSVVMFARGYGGIAAYTVLAGIYRENGTAVSRMTTAVSPPSAGQVSGSPSQMVDNHFGAVPIKLTATVTLTPGRYWGAWMQKAGGASDFAYHHVANDGYAADNFYLGTAFARAWYVDGQSALPTTANQAVGLIDHDRPVMALALT